MLTDIGTGKQLLVLTSGPTADLKKKTTYEETSRNGHNDIRAYLFQHVLIACFNLPTVRKALKTQCFHVRVWIL
jgi:hypothetical protein